MISPDAAGTAPTVTRICAYCGQAYTGALRSRYCSDAHRQAAYRERKKRTQPLR